MSAIQEKKLVIVLDCLKSMTPRIFDSLLLSSPFYDLLREERKKKVFKKEENKSLNNNNNNENNKEEEEGENKKNKNNYMSNNNDSLITADERIFLSEKFNQFLMDHNLFSEGGEGLMWSALEWVLKDYLPNFLYCICLCPPNNNNVMVGYRKVIESICNYFGLTYSQKILKLQFLSQLSLDSSSSPLSYFTEPNKTPSEIQLKRSKLFPIFLSVLAPTMEQIQFTSFFKESIHHLADNLFDWNRLTHTPSFGLGIQWLCQIDHSSKKKIINFLWELVVDKSVNVKLVCADLFGAMVLYFYFLFYFIYFLFYFNYYFILYFILF